MLKRLSLESLIGREIFEINELEGQIVLVDEYGEILMRFDLYDRTVYAADGNHFAEQVPND